jgi:hypothetical protein
MKCLFSFFLLWFFAGGPRINEIRKLYPTAANSEITATAFNAKLKTVVIDSNKTLVAYKGAGMTILSKFQKKTGDKMRGFKEGAKLIEMALKSEPNNAEIRMIRLSIQENVPGVVNYRKNRKEDKIFLLEHYKEQPKALSTYLKNFILQSKSFTAKEKASVQ